MTHEETYCPLIDHQIMIDYYGETSPCCHVRLAKSLDEFPEKISALRKEMASGKRMKACKRCWQDEDNGLESLRNVSLDLYKNQPIDQRLLSLDIRINNTCNLACTMCNSHASSLWAKLEGTDSASSINDAALDQLILQSASLIKISMQGGEVFYGTAFADFLERLPNKSQITLEFFTNAISIDVGLIKKWQSEFKYVMMIASVDGTKEVFEEIRWPAKWNNLQRKLDKVYPLLSAALSFNYTLQNSNLLCIKRFVDWRNERYPKSGITFSELHWPESLKFTNVNDVDRKLGIELIEQINSSFDYERARLKGLKNLLENSKTNDVTLTEKEVYLTKVNHLRRSHLREI